MGEKIFSLDDVFGTPPKLVRGRGVGIGRFEGSSGDDFYALFELSARSTRKRKLVQAKGTNNILVEPLDPQDHAHPNDQLWSYPAYIKFVDGSGCCVGNGIQTNFVHQEVLSHSNQRAGAILNYTLLKRFPILYFDGSSGESGEYRMIDAVAHEPDIDSKGVRQYTSRILALVFDGEAAMATSFCSNPKIPNCFLDEGGINSKETRIHRIGYISQIPRGSAKMLFTYTGNFIDERMEPHLEPVDVRLEGRNPEEVAKMVRAAMDPKQFIGVACIPSRGKPYILNFEKEK